MPTFTIRRAQPGDAATLLALIRELAAYEKALDFVQADEDRLRRWVLGETAFAEAYLAFVDGSPAAYAIVYPALGSYRGTPALYIEDIYIQQRWRGFGFGKRFMAFLARLVQERGYAHLSWGVLDWNQSSIEFYKRLGAVEHNGHISMRLEGEALRRLAAAEQ